MACYSSHRVKRLDLGTGLAYLYAGTGAAGDPGTNVESSPTAGNGVLRGPYGLATDGTNIFVGEYDGCRVRMVNNSGAPAALDGGLTISTNAADRRRWRWRRELQHSRWRAGQLDRETDTLINWPRWNLLRFK